MSYQQTLSVSANRVTRYYIYDNNPFIFYSKASATSCNNVLIQKDQNQIINVKLAAETICRYDLEVISSMHMHL